MALDDAAAPEAATNARSLLDPDEVATKATAPVHDVLAAVRPQFQEVADKLVAHASTGMVSAAIALLFVSQFEDVINELVASTLGEARKAIEKQIAEGSVSDG